MRARPGHHGRHRPSLARAVSDAHLHEAEGDSARLLRGADRPEGRDGGGGVRSDPQDPEGDVQVRAGLGPEREACAAEGGSEPYGCG